MLLAWNISFLTNKVGKTSLRVTQLFYYVFQYFHRDSTLTRDDSINHRTGHVRRRRSTCCHPQCVHFVRNIIHPHNTQNVNKRKKINLPIIQCHIPLNNTQVLLSRVPNHPVKSSATLQSGSDARQYRSYGHSVSTTAKTYDTPLLSRPRFSRGTVRWLNSSFHMRSPD